MKYNRGWFRGDTLNYAIGQGDLLVTPIQVMRMMAMVGRNGQDIQPYLLKGIGNEETVSFPPTRKVPVEMRDLDILMGFAFGGHGQYGTAAPDYIEGWMSPGKGDAQTKPPRTAACVRGLYHCGKTRECLLCFLESRISSKAS